MRARLIAASVLSVWASTGPAADLAEPRVDDAGWRAVARLAATPICDVFRAAPFTNDKYRKYKDLERDILLARKAMNERYGQASPDLAVLMPGDFVRPCR